MIFATLAIALIGLLLSLKIVRFDSNDDPFMLMLASGAYTGTPDAHLVFIHQTLGQALSTLYQVAPSWEWYTLFFLGLHVLAFATTLTCLTQDRLSRLLFLALLALISGFEIRCVSHLQFTTTAAFLAASGVTLLTSSLFPRSPRLVAPVGVGLLLISSLVRFESTVLVLFISGPMLAWFALRERRRALVTFGLLGLGLVAVRLTYRDLQDEAWRDYYAYNLVRALVYDEPLARELPEIPSSISRNDYQLFLRAFPPLEKFPVSTLQELHHLVQAQPVRDRFTKLVNRIGLFQVELVLLALTATLVLCSAERAQRACLGLSLVCFSGMLGATAFALTVKSRVFLAALSPLLIAIAQGIPRFPDSKPQRAAALSLLVLGLYLGVQGVSARLPLGEQRHLFYRQMAMLNGYLSTTDRAVSPVGASLHIEWGDPLRLSKDCPRGRIACLGWLTRSPHNRRFYSSFAELPERSALLVPESDSNAVLAEVQQSLRENHKISIRSVVVVHEGGFQIIELHRQGREAR